MKLWILIKNNPSKCNRKLLKFLKSKIKKIKKKHELKVVIVYEELYHKLPSNITNLPVLITQQGKMAVGNTEIMKNLNRSAASPTSKYIPPSDNINDYWRQEMLSGEQENDDTNDLMDSVRQRALSRTANHKEKINKSKKRITPSAPDTEEDRAILERMGDDNLTEMADDDMVKMFLANQETTPGM